jgi:NAD(P)-dependent dehydrogenase (short-subunit alcohol dehydrogenase family)
MTSRGYGRLLYLTAEPSRHPRNGMINLGVAKAAMNQFVRYIGLELAPHGITANLVAPATVHGTTMNQKLTPEELRALGAAAPDGTTRHARRGGQGVGLLGE